MEIEYHIEHEKLYCRITISLITNYLLIWYEILGRAMVTCSGRKRLGMNWWDNLKQLVNSILFYFFIIDNRFFKENLRMEKTVI